MSAVSVANCCGLKAVMANKFCQGTGEFENLESEGRS